MRDPVCDMEVDIDRSGAVQKSEYKGQTYSFCSSMCKEQFDKEPERYLLPTLSELRHTKRNPSGKNESRRLG
jgi:YHS domain-containing protein